MKNYLLPSALVLLFTATAAHAQLIGIQFQAGGTALTSTQVAGVVGQKNYNVITGESGTNLALVNNADVPVSTTLTFSSNDSYGTGTGTSSADTTLLSGKLSEAIGGTTVTLNDVTPGTYNLYVYTESDTLKGFGDYSVGTSTYEIQAQAGSDFTGFVRGTSTPTDTTFQTANYVEFEHVVVTSANESITLTAANAPGQNFYSAPFSGLQLQIAPEPATWALMVAGLLAIAGVSRIRRNS